MMRAADAHDSGLTEFCRTGAPLPPRTFGPITVTDIVRYVGASGDFNPLHHDEAAARAAGFPGIFSAGMFQAGLLSSYATDLFGVTRVRRFRVRFKEQVWPGDVLQCSGRVTDCRSTEAGVVTVSVDLEGRRDAGGVAVEGSAEFRWSDAKGRST